MIFLISSDNRALSVLNLAENKLGELVLPDGWALDYDEDDEEEERERVYKHTDGREQNNPPEGSKAEGIIAIANAIPDMGALSVLSLKSNGLLNKDSGTALADALKGNSILTELDISSNYDGHDSRSQDGPGFAHELAVGIRDSGAMTSLNLASNKLGVEGTTIIAAVLPKCT
jgi:hypothetical protein